MRARRAVVCAPPTGAVIPCTRIRPCTRFHQ
jgi:hypothetical protein